MKKVTITLFAFNELSKSAQNKALTDHRTINVGYDWSNPIVIDDAQNVGLIIKHFDVDHEIPFANGDFKNSDVQTAVLIMNRHKPETNSYKLAEAFLKELKSLEEQAENANDRDIKVGLGSQIHAEKRYFQNQLLMTYAYLLKSEYYHRVSNEAIIETFNACEMTFEQDGRMNNSKNEESTQQNNTPWDFVEKYYPNYSSSDDICRVLDLNLILERRNSIMDEEGTDLHNRYMTEFDGQIGAVVNEHDQLMKEIYEEAIAEYLKTI